jgi:hypothetical protein
MFQTCKKTFSMKCSMLKSIAKWAIQGINHIVLWILNYIYTLKGIFYCKHLVLLRKNH